MTFQDSFHEVAFNISFWTRNISSARILFWRGVQILPLTAIEELLLLFFRIISDLFTAFIKFLNESFLLIITSDQGLSSIFQF